ncbi:hypothetical protein EIP91_000066 [Steccherinum ochraceum]|uniref:Transmembrane protein n=1 Tax=Steccherinum ochraceum TaxID=92696 RepID=A0A4R0S4F4_9APHY|nr:hypothetical protein EIP91_000066 [Steccherinum ochraceum]
MTDWSSPLVQAAEGAAFTKLAHAVAGIFLWEFVVSLEFDFDFLIGKKKFRWPMIFYFAGRYIFLVTVVGLLVSQDYTKKLNCEALFMVEQLFGNMAIGFSSINLALRTMAIWNMNRYVVVPLVLAMLGHWALILQSANVTAAWIEGQGCVVTRTNNNTLAAIFIYSMCFDLIVMVLSAAKLLNKRGSSQIVRLLFQDGLIYFFIAFAANLLVTVFTLLNLNPVMDVIFNVPASCLDTIVSCRVVRRLHNFSSSGADLYSGSNSRSRDPVAVQPPRLPTSNFAVTYPRSQTASTGIHVQMDTFTVADTHDPVAAGKMHDSSSDLDSKGVVL